MTEAEQIISRLALEPLWPEGGYFKRTWSGAIKEGVSAGTAIYFLLTSHTFSAFHRLKADEIWHYYAGDPVDHLQLRQDLPPIHIRLGNDLLSREPDRVQVVVPAGVWQGARLAGGLNPGRGWALLGCTLCPGWRDEDFELGRRTDLFEMFPADASLIHSLTR